MQTATRQSFDFWCPGRLIVKDLLEASKGKAHANRVSINFRDARNDSLAFGDLKTQSIGDVREQIPGRPGAAMVSTCEQYHDGLNITLRYDPDVLSTADMASIQRAFQVSSLASAFTVVALKGL